VAYRLSRTVIVGFGKNDVFTGDGTILWYISVSMNYAQSTTPLAITIRDRLDGHFTSSKLGFEQVVEVEGDDRIDTRAPITFRYKFPNCLEYGSSFGLSVVGIHVRPQSVKEKIGPVG
jgi:hypothetical protein